MDTVNTIGDPTRSPSVQSKESEVDIELPPDPDPPGEAPDTDDDEVLTEEESFMTLTHAEQLAWEETIKKLENELKSRGDDFSQWADKITRRRMYAYSRMKKLEKSNQTRTEFYGNIDDFIQTFHGDLLNSEDYEINKDDVARNDTQIQTVTDGQGNEKNLKDIVKSDVKGNISVTDTPVITEVPTKEDNSKS